MTREELATKLRPGTFFRMKEEIFCVAYNSAKIEDGQFTTGNFCYLRKGYKTPWVFLEGDISSWTFVPIENVPLSLIREFLDLLAEDYAKNNEKTLNEFED